MVVYLDQKVQSIVSYCFGIRNLADIPHRINQCIGKKRLVIGRNLMNKSLLRTANMCDLVTCAIQIVCVWTRPGYKTRSITREKPASQPSGDFQLYKMEVGNGLEEHALCHLMQWLHTVIQSWNWTEKIYDYSSGIGRKIDKCQCGKQKLHQRR